MARGYIYEVAAAKKNLRGIDSSDFFEDVQALCVDYVSDEIDVQECIEDFLSYLEQFGFDIDRTEKSFVITKNAQKRYFERSYRELKKIAEQMTLEAFAASDVYKFRQLIQDDYGDCICESTDYGDKGMECIDYWIRTAKEGTYYIGGVVLMH